MIASRCKRPLQFVVGSAMKAITMIAGGFIASATTSVLLLCAVEAQERVSAAMAVPATVAAVKAMETTESGAAAMSAISACPICRAGPG